MKRNIRLTGFPKSLRSFPLPSLASLLQLVVFATIGSASAPALALAEPDPSCAAAFTPTYTIQGSGASSPLVDQVVTTQGVVVGDYEEPGALGGFYIQDAVGDGDPATSDGLFVFNGNNDSVSLGDLVRVTGTAGELQNQTQVSASSITACGTGSVAPVDVTFPMPSIDYLERYEGMLVRLPQTLYVTEHFQLGRLGQVVLSADGRLAQPTDVAIPGAPAMALQAANDLRRIIVDDELQLQNPDPIVFARGGQPLSASNTLRSGDTATGIVGVMTYTWSGINASGNAYRVRPINALGGFVLFEAANERPTLPPEVGGALRVAGVDLLNYFNTFVGCTDGVGGGASNCRGADNLEEFNRQWPKTVAALISTGADVVGLVEFENDGYGPDSAIQDLVNRLNDATAPGTWAFIDADANTNQVNALGTESIKVGIIYKPGIVTPVGLTAALNTESFVTGGDSVTRNRPALAQAFDQNSNDARFVLVVTHLKTRGNACDVPDAGDGQGNCNQVRTNAANELAIWLAGDPTETSTANVLLMGDLNAYAKEDPLTALATAGYTNLVDTFLGPDAYTYVFDGQWGSLQHALASSALAGRVTGAATHHINADEPSALDYNTNFKSAGQVLSLYAPDEYRASDHDPIVIGLDLSSAPPDTTPESFSFNAQTNVALSTLTTSESITVAGIDTAAAISIIGGNYSINDGAYTADAGSVNLDDKVTVQQTSSSSFSTTTTATLTIGGVSGVFEVTTLPMVSYTAPAAGSGDITASITGGGAACGYSHAQFVPLSGEAATTAPAGIVFPSGLFDFSVSDCTPGSTITMVITYPQPLPAGTTYWKYGRTQTNASDHWYQLPATISGDTVTFSITDGGLGDNDLTANGTIADPSGPGVPAASIPTLSQWSLLLLAGLMVLVSVGAMQRRMADGRPSP